MWRHRATGDDDFFLRVGAEIPTGYGPVLGIPSRKEVDGSGIFATSSGRGEYHEDVDDNAFANVLARWNIARALEPVELYQRVGPMKPARLDRSWRSATTCLRTGANE